ncbi:universal stress protein [Microvirga sp. STR05]|uniref:Universal stress protein n=1 Tax=Hymenobacter duratus TaxID=2771356 RepID=A0ABR8JJ05_9BACT|nr:universal stress protein [Hymenobacter duratus]MBD2715360.1 universal stress protein [Hymenobacter duratus]MBR7950267.1 universal stress protein [Microvirga sp. STR05]
MLTFYVLTDFSIAAANALHHALVLAQQAGAHVRLLHVVPSAPSAVAACFDCANPREAENNQRQLQEQVDWASRYVPASGKVLTGEPKQELTREMTAKGVLVVGNSNPAKAMHSAQCSTALYLVQNLTLPLLVVPATYRAGQPPRRIVFDMDRKPLRLPRAADVVSELFSYLTASGPPLQLCDGAGAVDELLSHIIPRVVGIHVYASEAGPEARDIANRIHQTGLLAGIAHTIATSRYPAIEEGIRHTAARHRADLLGFVVRQHMYPGPEFLQSVTAGLMAHSRIPVLAIPEK